ncbi:hypothetical protein O0L34_g960 [Tuta absoluta]|nr:hypothetical protein O0L34_g960 [Tuta absoluta]
MNQADVQFDEFCDPNNPRRIRYDDILAASRRIIGAVIRTPCTRAHTSEKLGMEVYLKQEFLQYTGCFKERGCRNTLMLLNDEQRKYGVIAATTGNHGAGLGYHARQLNVPCVIVLPITAAMNKVAKCERVGAKVLQHGNNMADAKTHALTIAKEKRMTYINGYDHPNIIEGQGTVGIEIIEQVPTVDAILIPVGGGSLLAGVAIAIKHLKPDTEIYGIETDKTCSMVESLRKNERVFMEIEPGTIADSLAINMVGVNTFYNVKGLVDKMIVVKEDWVARAVMHIVEDERFIVEGGGSVAYAAILAGLFPNLKGKKVVCILSGGNIDATILARALERGMAAEGRLVKFKVTVHDRPGGLSDLCGLLAGMGVILRDCIPERAWVKGDVFSVTMKIIAETRGWDHTKELVEQIKKHYNEYYFPDMGDRADKSPATRRGPCLAPNPVCMQK